MSARWLEGRYELLGPLGRGGVGSVFEARDHVFSRDVALKRLAFISAEGLEAFRREFLLLAGCTHPRMPRAYDLHRGASGGAEREGGPFYTAELVRGPTLARYAPGRSWADVARVIADAVDALSWLHDAGIVHGDFKPDNVLVREDASGVLIDLSGARLVRSRSDEVSGTERFIAPELLEGKPASPQSDLYGVGRTIELSLRASGIEAPRSLRDVVDRLLDPDPNGRPRSAAEVIAAIRTGTARHTARPTEPGRIVGRSAELETFQRLFDTFARKQAGPRVIVVSGSEGTGKTRLLRELSWRASVETAVAEGSAGRDDAVHELVARALDASVEPTIDAVLRARAELAARATPRVLVIDDTDRLSQTQRSLLLALLRAAGDRDAVLWILAASQPLGVASPAIVDLPLGPLDSKAIAAWMKPFVTAAPLADVERVSGGNPRTLKEIASAIASGTLSEVEVASFATHDDFTPIEARRAGSLGPDARLALAALVVSPFLDERSLQLLGIDRAAIDELDAATFARRDAGGVRLSRPVRSKALARVIGDEVVRDAARKLADALERHEHGDVPETELARAARLALRARALAMAGRPAEALTLTREAEPLAAWAPQAWMLATDTLCDAAPGPWSQLAAAHAVDAAGAPARAVRRVANALLLARKTRDRDVLAAIALTAARLYEKLGLEKRAMRQLSRIDLRATPQIEAAKASVEVRCLLRLGRYAEAEKLARHALSLEGAEPFRADLLESHGVVLGYLGDDKGAMAALERAVAARTDRAHPRARVRSLSYLALQAYRSGDTELAARGFGDALEAAESAGLGDMLGTAALNLGTARHQLGQWGVALASYERGLRAAVAFDVSRIVATLRFNLAKLHADVGLFDRAESELALIQREARAESSTDLTAAILGLEAEIAAGRGRAAEALRLLDRVQATHATRGAKREGCESALHAAEVALDANERATARDRLRAAQEGLAGLDAADLMLRAATIDAALALEEGDAQRAFDAIRSAEALVSRVSQLELHARLEDVAAEVFRRRGAPTLADRRRSSALECWERIASGLPDDLLEAFWRHPVRARLRTPSAEPEKGRRTELVMRILEVNRRLSSTLETNEILRLAMDASIELTGAERGFVILTKDGKVRGLEVAVARNLDRETVGKSQLKFSHSIAKRVVETGDAVLTVDALADDRFAKNASVHGMRLRSIACVPIRAHGKVLGAIYLDNRFLRGKFGADEADLLGAFADQIALALHNGRLMAELRQRTIELEEEQKRVAELMRSQATEIERLAHELERERHRTDNDGAFPEIAGRSAPMRSVLALVERVARSDVPVTVTGESGTGKELVARAIHAGGPRRDGPFVAVNCAALPEALLESELFGHVRGAFTGAVRDHGGLFLAARGGTIFLDEIGETPLAVQAKLLRVLQEREVRPVGGDRAIAVPDVRVVCATNRMLADEVARGAFREDLFYRISVIEVRLPPLRERPEDIPSITQTILEKIAKRQAVPAPRLAPAALRRLATYAWPGNVRQLENVLARAMVLASDDVIGAPDIELPSAAAPVRPAAGRTRSAFKSAEKERIVAALEAYQWNVCEVSRALGIPRTTLYRKLSQFGLLRT
ncbi:MAG: sigma 54-interacting transcriptional regulator [Polyangiaceae bacterium]|nr:sigma 54-interacting transcriptional regulator [Polyangiaceae bacterium]